MDRRIVRWLLLGCLCLNGLLALSLALPAGAGAQSTVAQSAGAEGSKEMIAVLDLQPVQASEAEAQAITDRLREVLLNSGHFTLVDRSQMDAILNEQALQQTGCTSQECAVQVGRVLGVRKLVTGKLVKVSDTIWLLSALVVDVETAETLRAASVRHRGDFFTLMDDRVRDLGEQLAMAPAALQASPASAHVTPPPPPAAATAPTPVVAAVRAPTPAAAPTAPPAAPDSSHAIAIFPPAYAMGSGALEDNSELARNTLTFRLRQLFPDYAVAYAYGVDGGAGSGPQADAEIAKGAWSGFFSKQPDDAYVYRKARELRVAYVMMFKGSLSGKTDGAFTAYVYDVAKERRYTKDGKWWSGQLNANVANELMTLFRRATASS